MRPPAGEPPLPALESLGQDLLRTSAGQRLVTLGRPLACVAAYGILAGGGLWWLTPPVVFLLFVAVVTATHDVVHGSLGLGRRSTDIALFLLGGLLLESGHAYRSTHLQHHRVFPGADDPEGDPARLGFWQAVAYGPLFLPRLWVWAYRRSRGRPAERSWLLLEAVWALGVPLAALFLFRSPGAGFYVVQVLAGSWVYPVLTVHLPHRHYGESPLEQTSTLRGRFLPRLFLELTYHLEHHLYPGVPSHHLADLSRRLEAFFRKVGVRPRQVP